VIVEWLAEIGANLGLWVISWFDGIEIPDWFGMFAELLAQVLASAAGMGAWVPWGLLFSVVGAVFTLWGIIILVKAVRWVVGWVPTMGGS